MTGNQANYGGGIISDGLLTLGNTIPEGMDPDRIRRECDAFAEAGIQHVVAAPWRKDPDDWLRSMEQLAALVGLTTR